VADGPRLLRAAADGPVVTLEFDQPLATSDGKVPRHFTLAQAGGGFQPASEVKVEGNKVLISNSRVRTPVEVRYGWDEAAVTNLCNPQGLPARQFRVRLPFEKK
ncbi:MAG: sialate O-acetylesterase, partial [Bacteroidales bacterium]|nr:sialate O-acetylesterase [Bacteroidales bacterium]